ncbi:MAG: sugar phosphate isomerase/epimerase [Clostridiales bacterium]|nr:sugar phosphate isomerase/epimerase [Clostridiales bacterium]
MEVGISTASLFRRAYTEDAPALLRGAGTAFCEIFLNTFSEYEPGYIDLLCERVAAQNLRVLAVHPQSLQFEPQLFSIYDRQREDALMFYRKILHAGQKLGAKYYVLHGSATLGGAAKNIQVERLAKHYQLLCDTAGEYGLTLTQENVSWCNSQTPDFGLRLQEQMGNRDLKFTLDCKQARRAGQEPMAFIEAWGDQIVHWHLCDYAPNPAGGHQWRMPGQGVCDFAALARALRAKGYRGAAMLEVYSDMYSDLDELAASYDYLRNILP